MLNQQLPSPLARRNDGWLSVHSIFPTIQGEGPYAGQPAIFLRLCGCNLQCPACDTEYTDSRFRTETNPEATFAPEAIMLKVAKAANRAIRLLVITGGEPFRQNLIPLCQEGLRQGWFVQIETNGTIWQKDMAVLCKLWPNNFTIVCSPKTGKIAQGIYEHAHAFKYIVDVNSISHITGLPVTTMLNPDCSVARPRPGARVYVQPLDVQDEMANRHNMTAAVDSCMRFGHTLSLQMHKIANLE